MADSLQVCAAAQRSFSHLVPRAVTHEQERDSTKVGRGGINVSPLVSTGLRPGLGLGSSVTPAPQDLVVPPVDTGSRPQTASPILSRDAQLWPEGSGGPGPQSVLRGWAQDTQGSRATRSGLSWTARGASVPGSGQGEHGGQLTGALGEPTRPPYSPMR